MNERMHARTKLVNAAQTYARTKSMNEHTDVSTNKVNERTYGQMNESSDGKTDKKKKEADVRTDELTE